MGIIYIGDRNVGKTHLALELTNPKHRYVRVTSLDYEYLKALLYSQEEEKTKATDASQVIYQEYFEVEVNLSTRIKTMTLDWLDTPGEIWRSQWQHKNQEQWQKFLETIQKADGILLILPPYREIIIPNKTTPEEYITRQQWCQRFERWVSFFAQDCSKIRHLILCLNKADLFCHNLQSEAQRLAYEPTNSPMTWQQRDDYIFQRYFRPIHEQIHQLNRSIQGLSVRCFITSVYNRELLELPWIYLGSHLGT